MVCRAIVDGLEVSYVRVCPQKQKVPVVVFLHGWKGKKEVWDKNIFHLSKDFDCIAVDLPAFGQSEGPKMPWGIGQYADFLNVFIENLGLGKVVLVGKSFGGRVAIYFAYKYPDKLSKLVLVSAAGVEGKSFLTKSKILAAKSFKFVLSSFGVSPESFYKSNLGGVFCKIFKISQEESFYKLEVKKLVTSLDLSFYCAQIKVPTLIIWGREDKVLPLKMGKKLHHLIKGSRLAIINGGHNAHIEYSDDFNEALAGFVDGSFMERSDAASYK